MGRRRIRWWPEGEGDSNQGPPVVRSHDSSNQTFTDQQLFNEVSEWVWWEIKGTAQCVRVCVHVCLGGLFVEIPLPLSLWSPQVTPTCLSSSIHSTAVYQQRTEGQARTRAALERGGSLHRSPYRSTSGGETPQAMWESGRHTHSNGKKKNPNSLGSWNLPLCPINPDRPPQLQVHRVGTTPTCVCVNVCACVLRFALSETPAIDQGSRRESRVIFWEWSSSFELNLSWQSQAQNILQLETKGSFMYNSTAGF